MQTGTLTQIASISKMHASTDSPTLSITKCKQQPIHPINFYDTPTLGQRMCVSVHVPTHMRPPDFCTLGAAPSNPCTWGLRRQTPAVALLLGSNVVSAMLSTFMGNLQERSSDITLVVPCYGRVQRFLLFHISYGGVQRISQIAISGRLLFRGRRLTFYSRG